jgi:hypothetical protein
MTTALREQFGVIDLNSDGATVAGTSVLRIEERAIENCKYSHIHID